MYVILRESIDDSFIRVLFFTKQRERMRGGRRDTLWI